MSLYHATCIAINGKGILLEGPSGAGKSDLALRLISRGGVLVGDDYLTLSAKKNQLLATVPGNIAGKMEVRGVGVMDVDYVPETTIALAIELVPRGEVPRLPENKVKTLEDIKIPVLALHAFDASTPDKIILALDKF